MVRVSGRGCGERLDSVHADAGAEHAHAGVCVRLAEWIIGSMGVPMMLIVNVAVLVAERRMFVFMLMSLGQV